ncbi:MAG: hypothetical protein QOJ14_376 [Thermoleophilaceae bacterium]|nr:hypothetical protein [Thermoleophilaceae bacterium]
MNVRLAWLLTVTAVILPAGETSAKPRFEPVAKASGGVVAGSRYIAWPGTGGGAPIRLVDMKKGEQRAVPLPPGCESGWAPSKIGAGKLVWECYENEALVQDIASGAEYHVDLSGGDADGVGARWVRILVPGDDHDYQSYAWTDYRTGEGPSSRAARRALYRRRWVDDLDFPSLARRLCAPIQRDRASGPLFQAFQYEKPWALRILDYRRLLLDRCGRSSTILAKRPVRNQVLRDGWVTWADARGVHAYLPRTRRSVGWKLDEIGPHVADNCILQVTHTRRAIFVAATRDCFARSARIYIARRPAG